MRRLVRFAVVLAVLGSTLAVTGTATASPTGGLSGPLAAFANCGYGAERQAFLPWLDLAEYSLAPNGDLASTSGWTLDGSATSSGHDPYASPPARSSSTGTATAPRPPGCA